MNTYTRISIPLLKEDLVTLRDDAAKHYREPRQHAAWLLRQVLSAPSGHPSEQQAAQPPESQSQPQRPVAA